MTHALFFTGSAAKQPFYEKQQEDSRYSQYRRDEGVDQIYADAYAHQGAEKVQHHQLREAQQCVEGEFEGEAYGCAENFQQHDNAA